MDSFDRPRSYTRRQWQLLAAAVRLLDRVGISEFTMRALADETGLSPMAAYKHFENQRALQLELWRMCQNHFYDTLLEATELSPDPSTGFLDLCRAFMVYSIRYPYRYELLHNHPFVREVATIESLDESRTAVWAYARDLLERAQGSGVFRGDLRTDVLLAAASAQVRGLAGALIYSDSQALGEIAADELIESGMAFIREALLAR